MRIWTKSGNEYEITKIPGSGILVKKTGGRIEPPSIPSVGEILGGDEVFVKKGSPCVLKKNGKVVMTTSPVTAIFK